MNKRVIIFILLLLANTLFAQDRQRKALFVIVDGIPADVIERVRKPFLDSIAKIGEYVPAYVGGEKGGYSEMPTISRGFSECINDLKSSKNFIITSSKESFINKSKGIVFCGLEYFLIHHLPKIGK